MSQGVKDLINAIAEGDAITIDAAFNTEMATRISARLEDMRVQVAQNMFSNPVAEEVESEDDVELFSEEIDIDELASIIESLTDEDFDDLTEENTLELEEKYEGFAKLKGELAHKAGVKNPGALAAAIGRKKYGKEKFQAAAAKGKKLHEAGTLTGKVVKGVARVGNELKDAGKGAAELGGQAVGTVAKTVGAVAALPGATRAAYQQGKAATYKSVAEEAEQIDELKASTLTSYVKKAGASLDKSHNAANKAYKKYDDTDDDKDIAAGDKAHATYNKRHAGMSTALQKLSKKAKDSSLGEEVEQNKLTK